MQQLSEIDVNGHKIPIKVIAEHRYSSRASLGSEQVILRIPLSEYKSSGVEPKLKWLHNWLCKLQVSKPYILERYNPTEKYENGKILLIASQAYRISINKENRTTATIRLTNNEKLEIKIPDQGNFNEQKLVKQLIVRFCQRHFLPYIYNKVKAFNDAYFRQEITSVKLKYNKSNWGSCSRGRNLNFSVRLLLAPDDVIDYVVVHELAHLIEMNHSPRFWKIVQDVIPDYKAKEKTLKTEGNRFDF